MVLDMVGAPSVAKKLNDRGTLVGLFVSWPFGFNESAPSESSRDSDTEFRENADHVIVEVKKTRGTGL